MYDIFYIGPKPNDVKHARQVTSLSEAYELCKTRYFWIVNYLSDYKGFDFLYEPVPWEAHQRHVWQSQWQQDGGTWLVPKNGYTDTNYHSEVVHRTASNNIVLIDHGNVDNDLNAYQFKTRYVNSYLETLKRIVNKWNGKDDWIWVISSICDYKEFDFSWHPDEWQQELIHVFPSDEQKFGDTFYVHVPTAREKLKNAKSLEWVNINFIDYLGVYRKPIPINMHNADTHVIPVQNHNFTAPIEVFTIFPYLQSWKKVAVSLWAPETKTIVVATDCSNTIIVPREAQGYIKTQLYDYPYIQKKSNSQRSYLPAVFVDNGESCADENYEYAKEVLPNEVFRVQGVKGRKASQLAAANSVESAWYFFIPAKLKVNPDFPWHWHPDKLQAPKHYIFHAENTVTELVYGHMAAVCYCKNYVLQTQGYELDFTMESPHAVVPLVSGIALYTADPKMAWRTAFREVIKLKHSLSKTPDIETDYRIESWLTKGNGPLGLYSQLGAQAAVDYYLNVNGDLDKLKLTYEWEFLDHLWDNASPHLNLK